MSLIQQSYYITYHDIYVQRKGNGMYYSELDGLFGPVTEDRKATIRRLVGEQELRLQANTDFHELVLAGEDDEKVTFELLEAQLKSHTFGLVYHKEFEGKLNRLKDTV
jgi:hypothetical protein